VALEHKTLWLAAERSGGRSAPDVIQLIDGYKRLLLAAQPVDGDDANYKSIVVVFSDLPAAQAKDFFSGALQEIGIPSYVDDGLVMGPFYEGNDGTAIYNPNFRPFTSPVPFLLMSARSSATGSFSWTTKIGSGFGHVAMESLQSKLLPTNYVACRGVQGATSWKEMCR
jgi:hypothetical protein